jgi:hypothetical protein
MRANTGTRGRVERGLSPSHSSNPSLAPFGWVDDRDGRPGARLSRPAASRNYPRNSLLNGLEGAQMTVGYTLGPNEGEHLVLRGGSIFIKADPSRGS